MVPDPLHPAVVHFPIVFAVLLPIVAGIALWAIRRGTGARRAWAAPVALAAALSLSAWAATETGEDQEERVETVVAEAPLETHEAAADRFLVGSLGVLTIMVVGLAGGRVGSIARGLGLVATLALTVAGYQVGHSGGELVYRHGAASAYTVPDSNAPRFAPERERHRDR
ncbi:MAG: hypothetical protein KF785_11835 [Gemmatimonadales bacterium]|nr:hypothetical protein [Gemmatimonadales bacterium]